MKLVLHLSDYGWPIEPAEMPALLTDMAELADEGGIDGIAVAGEGERRTLAFVARYGDACSFRPSPEIPRKLDVLRRHCEQAGTDFDRIERTCAYEFAADDGGPQTKELIERLHSLAELGIDTVIGRVRDLEQRAPLEHLVRHVVPAVREFSGRGTGTS